VKEIVDLDGKSWYSQEGIEGAFVRYFQWLYKAEAVVEIGPCINAITPKVSSEMNQSLLAPVTLEEIQNALNQMDPLKAPRPDRKFILNKREKREILSAQRPKLHKKDTDIFNAHESVPVFKKSRYTL
jgi:hypothetical protein